MKVQVDIPKELNKKLKIFKIEKDFQTLSQAIIYILNKKFNKNGKNKI